MTTWWEKFPGRLEAELEEFSVRGLEFELDKELFRDADRVLLRGHLAIVDGGPVALEVLYPDLFPYFRPEVYAPTLDLPRHQNPVLKNLCLLDRESRAWQPERTAAWLVAERVPYLLGLFQSAEAMLAAESPQGEPVSAYSDPPIGATLLIPEEALELDHRVAFGTGRVRFSLDWPPQALIRGVLSDLVTRENKKLRHIARADPLLQKRFGGKELALRWVRLNAPPTTLDAQGLIDAAEASQLGYGSPNWQSVADGEIAITGVVFPEEVRQGQYEDAWLFAVRFRRLSQNKAHEGQYVVRGERFSRPDLAARIPSIAALRSFTVAQIGLGAIGAPLALEFARNQIEEIRLLEGDHIEGAQIVRWPFGVDAVAFTKLATVADFIERNYPFTAVQRFPMRLGQTALQRSDRTTSELELFDRFISGADLIVDASAEISVQQLVSDFARCRDLPQLFVSATAGARGGQITLIADSGGCWQCWRLHQTAGDIPIPPEAEDAVVQPRGCASPTFTGTSFDLLPIVAQAARVAAAVARANGSAQSKVWVMELAGHAFGPPLWSTHEIAVHPECPYCH